MQISVKLILSSLLLISFVLNAQTFQQITINPGLPDLENSCMAMGDYDQDGDYDVL